MGPGKILQEEREVNAGPLVAVAGVPVTLNVMSCERCALELLL